jgi:hypothetical protein
MPDPVAEAPGATAEGSPPAANTSPWYSDWQKPDGTINPESFKRLPEDIRWAGEPLSKYNTAEDLVRGFANLTTLVGKKGLIPLPANSSPEAIAERKALLDGINGVPKTGKDYGLTRPSDVPEQAWDAGYVEKVSDWAQKHSIGPAAMKELLSGVVAPQVKGQLANAETQRTTFLANEDRLFEEQIGKDALTRDKADALAERGATDLGFDLAVPAQAGLLKYAAVKLAMVKHALSVGEDAYVAGEGAKGEGGDAFALAQDAASNPANPFYAPLYDSQHPQHAMAKEKVDQLFARAQAMAERSAGRR